MCRRPLNMLHANVSYLIGLVAAWMNSPALSYKIKEDLDNDITSPARTKPGWDPAFKKYSTKLRSKWTRGWEPQWISIEGRLFEK